MRSMVVTLQLPTAVGSGAALIGRGETASTTTADISAAAVRLQDFDLRAALLMAISARGAVIDRIRCSLPAHSREVLALDQNAGRLACERRAKAPAEGFFDAD